MILYDQTKDEKKREILYIENYRICQSKYHTNGKYDHQQIGIQLRIKELEILKNIILRMNLLSLVDMFFFNSQSIFLWISIVLHYSPTYPVIRRRQTLYRDFSRKTKGS